MKLSILSVVALFVTVPTLQAQHAAAAQTVNTPMATTTTTGELSNDGTRVMVENRARVFGDRMSGSGTRYFALKDADLTGKTASAILNSLSPTAIGPQQKVRQFNIVVDLHKPLILDASSTAPVAIGTATVSAPANNRLLLISTNISTSGVTVKK